jgi:hypothetical protein
METIVVYSAGVSNRLKYVLDWLFRERLHVGYRLVDDEKETAGQAVFISYGKALPDSISIPFNGLLSQKGIQKRELNTGTWENIPTIFAEPDKDYTLPFDLFSAIFYLLSRYEEYYPYKPDNHDRYPASASILYKNGWLQRPLVDEWVAALIKILQAEPSLAIATPHFLFLPTYDIDMAYSHLYKGFGRILGAYVRALIRVDIRQISERTQVLKRKQKDPFDSFRWLRQLHKEYGCKPVYFVLASHKRTKFDKNVHPQHPAMVRIIKNLAKEGTVGIHPSYYCWSRETFDQEKSTLEQITTRKIPVSRQHYIRLKTPETWRRLLKSGITEDYSMGYGAYLGFRAGTGNSFFWYDIENEETTMLRVHPFCFMDTTAHYAMKLSPSDAFAKLEEMSKRLEQTGSVLVTIFHNFTLGTGSEWKGWRQAYENFMHEKSKL